MKKLEVFDPPLCCSTGVCGPSVDPALVQFAADLHWLANQKAAVERYNLAQQPEAFAANEIVKTALRQPYAGTESIGFEVADSNPHAVASESPAPRTEAAPTHTDPEPLPPIEGEPEPQVPTFQTTVFGTTVSTRGDLEGKIYFIPPVQRLPNLSKLKPVGSIYAKFLNVPLTEFREGFPGVTDRFEWFAIEYTGTFYVTDPGKYYFRLRSDDGSKLFIDGKVVINIEGLGTFESVGSKTLTAGVHDIRIDYFQGSRYHLELILKCSIPEQNVSRSSIPMTSFCIPTHRCPHSRRAGNVKNNLSHSPDSAPLDYRGHGRYPVSVRTTKITHHLPFSEPAEHRNREAIKREQDVYAFAGPHARRHGW